MDSTLTKTKAKTLIFIFAKIISLRKNHLVVEYIYIYIYLYAYSNPCCQCYEWVLKKAQQLDWSEDSAKALVVIGDAEPHPPSYTDQSIHWRDELDVLTGMDVKVGAMIFLVLLFGLIMLF